MILWWYDIVILKCVTRISTNHAYYDPALFFHFPISINHSSFSLLHIHKHVVYGSSIVWHCLPRGRGSAPCPYQCRVMVVFPACNKSRRWHRMSAASCAGTPNMYPLPPNTVHCSQRKCYRGAIYAACFHIITHTVHLCAWDQTWLRDAV